MRFQADDFRTFAKKLMTTGRDEATVRSAISRIYYAAHLLAVRKLAEKNWFEPTGSGGDHDGAIRALQKHKTRDRAGQLKLLMELRQHADYHLESEDGPYNQGCGICSKLPPNADPVTDIKMWEEAAEVAEHFIPLIQKL